MTGVRQSFSGHSAIHQSVEAARAFGEALGLGDDDRARLCILVEELVANLFDHGGLGEGDGVEMRLEALGSGVRLTLFDRGIRFDPREAPHRPVPERGGGAGLELVRTWARSIDYRTTPEGNRLELLLPVSL